MNYLAVLQGCPCYSGEAGTRAQCCQEIGEEQFSLFADDPKIFRQVVAASQYDLSNCDTGGSLLRRNPRTPVELTSC